MLTPAHGPDTDEETLRQIDTAVAEHIPAPQIIVGCLALEDRHPRTFGPFVGHLRPEPLQFDEVGYGPALVFFEAEAGPCRHLGFGHHVLLCRPG